MAGNILKLAQRDMNRHVTTSGWEENITLSTPDSLLTIQTTGLSSEHWVNYDTDGQSVNAKNAHVCLSEEKLTELNYPVRNSENEVFLLNHKVSKENKNGVLKNYIIKQWFPDETLGVIVCILGDYDIN